MGTEYAVIVGIGFDLAEVNRFRKQVSRQGEDFLRQFLTDSELADCSSAPRPFSACAERFAAKEAFAKAVGTRVMGSLSWQDVVVGRDERGKACLQLAGRAKLAADGLAIDRIHLSVTHEGDTAAAVVLLEAGGQIEPRSGTEAPGLAIELPRSDQIER